MRSTFADRNPGGILLVKLFGASLLILLVVGLLAADFVGWFRERAEAKEMWSPERIEVVRADPRLRAELAEIIDLCRGFDRQMCHFAYKAAKTIREADLEARNMRMAEELKRISP